MALVHADIVDNDDITEALSKLHATCLTLATGFFKERGKPMHLLIGRFLDTQSITISHFSMLVASIASPA